jgi:uncharacterized protein DUF6582
MNMVATWKAHEKQGSLTKRSDLPDSVFAYPAQRKEPMTNAAHVRNALARFDQVEGVSDAERASAFANIKKAAAHFGVDVSEKNWRELGRKPSKKVSKTTARKKPAARSADKAKTRAKKAPAKRAGRARSRSAST